VHTKHAGNFNRLLNEQTSDAQIRLIQVSEVGLDTAMVLQEKVAAGEFVVIAADRIPISSQQHVKMVPFMGKPAPFPKGAFILASILQCPVIQIFCVKQNNRFHIFLEKLGDMTNVARKKRSALVDEMVTTFANRLAYYAQTYRYQWFNFYDFWDQPVSRMVHNKIVE
jgi:predicted LPLAT superfamily acyltransferase